MNAQRAAFPLFVLTAAVLLGYYALGLIDDFTSRPLIDGFHSALTWIMIAAWAIGAGAELKARRSCTWAVTLAVFGVLNGIIGIVFAKTRLVVWVLAMVLVSMSGLTALACGYVTYDGRQGPAPSDAREDEAA